MNTICKRFGRAIWWAIGSAAVMASLQAQTTPAVPTITTSIAAMTFQYQIGAATLPPAQTMQILSSPVGLNFTVAVGGAPFNAAWLLVSTSIGKAPAPLK